MDFKCSAHVRNIICLISVCFACIFFLLTSIAVAQPPDEFQDCNDNGIDDAIELVTIPISTLVPDRYEFRGGDSSDGDNCGSNNNIGDGGNDMYDCGNYLGTNLESQFFYTDSVVTSSDSIFGSGSEYFTAKFPGIFILGADNISISSFSLSGNNGADGGGSVDGYINDIMVGGETFTILVKRIWNAFDPSINQIVIVPGGTTGLSQSISGNTNDGYHEVFGLSDRTRLFYILVARANGGFLNEDDIESIATAFLELVDGQSLNDALIDLDVNAITATDCNENGVLDECDIDAGDATDCDGNLLPDSCDIEIEDCNSNGVPDTCDLSFNGGQSFDCNYNRRPDECDITDWEGVELEVFNRDAADGGEDGEQAMTAIVDLDANDNGFLDQCEDCNGNQLRDLCDLDAETSYWYLSSKGPDDQQEPPYLQFCSDHYYCYYHDDACGQSLDVNTNTVPDECENDCNANSIPDDLDIDQGAPDCNMNGAPDECDFQTPLVASVIDSPIGNYIEGSFYSFCGDSLLYLYPMGDGRVGKRVVGLFGTAEGRMKDLTVDTFGDGTVYGVGCNVDSFNRDIWGFGTAGVGDNGEPMPFNQQIYTIDPVTGMAAPIMPGLLGEGITSFDDQLFGLTSDLGNGSLFSVGFFRFAGVNPQDGEISQAGEDHFAGFGMASVPNLDGEGFVNISLVSPDFFKQRNVAQGIGIEGCEAGVINGHCTSPEQEFCENESFGYVVGSAPVFDTEGVQDDESCEGCGGYTEFCRSLVDIAFGSDGVLYGVTQLNYWNNHPRPEWDLVRLVLVEEDGEGDGDGDSGGPIPMSVFGPAQDNGGPAFRMETITGLAWSPWGLGRNLKAPVSADCDTNEVPDECQLDCDLDGVPDSCEADRDEDGTVDDCDGCPDDANKLEAGVCGCGVADTDIDSDDLPDCIDACPNDADKIDAGLCGCGVSDTDSDGDGVPDCNDICPGVPDIQGCDFGPGECDPENLSADDDNDGTTNCQEEEDGTDPLDPGDFIERLAETACTGANGFFQQLNILTVVNKLGRDLAVRVEYRDLFGALQGTVERVIGAFLKVDIDVGQLGLGIDTYGTICVFTDADGPGGWSGDIRQYKRPGTNNVTAEGKVRALRATDSFEYVLRYPFRNPVMGATALSINTNPVGVGAGAVVANWIRITDAMPGDGVGLFGEIQYFDLFGKMVTSQPVGLGDGARFDFPGHEALGANQVGKAVFIPTSPAAKYDIELSRYHYAADIGLGGNFKTATQIEARPLTGAQTTGYLSNDAAETSIVEIINGSGNDMLASFEGFDISGLSDGTQGLFLAGNGSHHRIIGGTDLFASGLAPQSAELSGQSASLSAVTLVYNINSDGELDYAYAPPFVVPQGMAQIVDFNGFLGQENRLNVTNASDKVVDAEVSVIASSGETTAIFNLSLEPRGFEEVVLNDVASGGIADQIGTVIVRASDRVVVRNFVEKQGDYVIPITGTNVDL